MEEKKANRTLIYLQIIVCGLIFAVFSFTYLYVFQRELLGALHFTLSHGRTHYVALPSALVITAILLLLRWGINSLLGLKSVLRAFAYFPSFLALSALTDIGRTIYKADYNSYWLWALPVGILAFAIIATILRRVLRTFLNQYVHPTAMLAWNLLIMLVFCLMTVSIGNTDRMLHLELKSERLLREGQYGAAAAVGKTVKETSRTLTALRAYALSKEGRLGESFFDFPQPYGSKGLFFPTDSAQTLRMTNDSIYYMLGVRPEMGKTPNTDFLASVCHKGIAKHVALEYYLTSLLLDKNLKTFAREVKINYFANDSLPKFFRQAAAMYVYTHPTDSLTSSNGEEVRQYADYLKKKEETSRLSYPRNRMQEEYGSTYWWYYDFQ